MDVANILSICILSFNFVNGTLNCTEVKLRAKHGLLTVSVLGVRNQTPRLGDPPGQRWPLQMPSLCLMQHLEYLI